MDSNYQSPRIRRANMDKQTALLLQRALTSLEREARRRQAEKQLRNERGALEAHWDESQVAHIREWCQNA